MPLCPPASAIACTAALQGQTSPGRLPRDLLDVPCLLPGGDWEPEASFALIAVLDPLFPFRSLANWAPTPGAMPLMSLAVPATVIGTQVARTDLLTRPDRHRRLLVDGGTAALLVGALGAVPFLAVLEGGMPAWVVSSAYPLFALTGLVSACGWLALLAGWAGPGTGEPLSGARWAPAALGRRCRPTWGSQCSSPSSWACWSWPG